MNQRTRRPLTTINVTPLVDVLLILLVILMLAMPLFVKRLPVAMPETTLDGTPIAVKALRVGLGAGQSYFLDESKATLADVLGHISRETTVELYIDEAVTYKDLAKFTATLYEKSPKEVVLMSR